MVEGARRGGREQERAEHRLGRGRARRGRGSVVAIRGAAGTGLPERCRGEEELRVGGPAREGRYAGAAGSGDGSRGGEERGDAHGAE